MKYLGIPFDFTVCVFFVELSIPARLDIIEECRVFIGCQVIFVIYEQHPNDRVLKLFRKEEFNGFQKLKKKNLLNIKDQF